MSKFFNQITCELMGGHKVIRQNISTFVQPNTTVKSEFCNFKQLSQYRVGVEFAKTFFAKDYTEAQHLKQQFIYELKLEIYGDLVSKLRDLEFAIYSQDRDKSKTLFKDIMGEVTP